MPPGLGAGQKTLIVLAIVITVLLTAMSIYFVVWTQSISKPSGPQFDVLQQAKQRQDAKLNAYEEKLAALPEGTLPRSWRCGDALKTFESGDLATAHTLAEAFFAGGNLFTLLDMATLAHSLHAKSPLSDFERSLQPEEHTSEEIEQALLAFLRGCEELDQLAAAARNGIYYVAIDPTVEEWRHTYGEDKAPGRHVPAILMALRAQLEARWGTMDDAFSAYLDAVRFAEIIGSDPFLSNQDTRYEAAWRADIALWEMIGRFDLPEAALNAIDDERARRADTTRLKELVMEDMELDFPRSANREDLNNPIFGKMASLAGIYDPKTAHEEAAKLAALIDRPYLEMRDAIKKRRAPGEAEVYDWQSSDVRNSALSVRRAQLRSTLIGDTVRVALALKRYKAGRGAYPKAIAETMPDYLESVPADPVTGKSIEYMPWNDGYFLFVPADDEEDKGGEERLAYGYGYSQSTLWHAKK